MLRLHLRRHSGRYPSGRDRACFSGSSLSDLSVRRCGWSDSEDRFLPDSPFHDEVPVEERNGRSSYQRVHLSLALRNFQERSCRT